MRFFHMRAIVRLTIIFLLMAGIVSPVNAATNRQAAGGAGNLVDSLIEVVAVNGSPASDNNPPVAVNVGDIVSFRVNIRNHHKETLNDLVLGADWGGGLAYAGNLTSSQIDCRYNENDERIEVNIAGLPSTGDRPSDYWYGFDLKVMACHGLAVNFHSDELYAGQSIKTYQLALQMETPKIGYTVSSCYIATQLHYLDGNSFWRVEIELENSGTGAAYNFFLDTDFNKSRIKVSDVSTPFVYDSRTSSFSTESPIVPGQPVVLRFDAQATPFPEDNDAPSTPFPYNKATLEMRLHLRYDNACGLRFDAPQQIVKFDRRTAADSCPTASYQPAGDPTADLSLMVTPESCYVAGDGTPLTWTIYVTNRGDDTAANIQLSDVLGPDLLFQNANLDGRPVATDVVKNVPSLGMTRLLWTLGDIPPSTTRQVTLTATPRIGMGQSNVLINPSRVYVEAGAEDGFQRLAYLEAPKLNFSDVVGAGNIPDAGISGRAVYGGKSNVHGSLSVTRMHTDNLYRTAEDEESLWITYVTPSFWAAIPGSNKRTVDIITSTATPGGLSIQPFYPDDDRIYQAYLLYSPQVELYNTSSRDNMTTHKADAYFRYNTRNKLSVRVMDQFRRTHHAVGSRTLTIDDRYDSNYFNTGATFEPTQKLEFRLDYTNYYLDYSSSRDDWANRMDNSCSFYSFFNLTAKTAIFAEYEFVDVDYDTNDIDSSENRYFAGFRWQMTKKSKGRVKVGVGEKDYDEAVFEDADTWMAELAVEHQFSPKTRFTLNATRRYDEWLSGNLDITSLPTDYYTHILTQSVGLGMAYDVTAKIHLDCRVTYTDDAYENEGLALTDEREDTVNNASLLLRYDIKKWLAVELAYIYDDRDSNYDQNDYTNNIGFARISIHR